MAPHTNVVSDYSTSTGLQQIVMLIRQAVLTVSVTWFDLIDQVTLPEPSHRADRA